MILFCDERKYKINRIFTDGFKLNLTNKYDLYLRRNE